ncbi:hypothetical protein [Sphingobacterium faecium]|uniref:hypothetical protein n=1 Tax=Sphingobacterium faecium TaxID=34087 RepID=UPI0024687487|nr:hypothetical protein [Sphingobacterium faecium]MDH5828887.1 hypothetical protein [Sphingobacterium faecium]WGQ17018.1 hypothetical protein QG727_22855 [Sphingobacterium faecium]
MMRLIKLVMYALLFVFIMVNSMVGVFEGSNKHSAIATFLVLALVVIALVKRFVFPISKRA